MHATIFVAGAVTALAGAALILYGGPRARSRRDAIEDWIEDVKEEVLDRMTQLRSMTPKVYEALVDEITEEARTAGELADTQVRRAAARLKSRYEQMKQSAREFPETREKDE